MKALVSFQGHKKRAGAFQHLPEFLILCQRRIAVQFSVNLSFWERTYRSLSCHSSLPKIKSSMSMTTNLIIVTSFVVLSIIQYIQEMPKYA